MEDGAAPGDPGHDAPMPGFGHTVATADGPALFALGQAGYALRAGGTGRVIPAERSSAVESHGSMSTSAPPARSA